MNSGLSLKEQGKILKPFQKYLFWHSNFDKPVSGFSDYIFDDSGDYQIAIYQGNEGIAFVLGIQFLPGGKELLVQYTIPQLPSRASYDKLELIVYFYNLNSTNDYHANFCRLTNGRYSIWVNGLYPSTTFDKNTIEEILVSIQRFGNQLLCKLISA